MPTPFQGVHDFLESVGALGSFLETMVFHGFYITRRDSRLERVGEHHLPTSGFAHPLGIGFSEDNVCAIQLVLSSPGTLFAPIPEHDMIGHAYAYEGACPDDSTRKGAPRRNCSPESEGEAGTLSQETGSRPHPKRLMPAIELPDLWLGLEVW